MLANTTLMSAKSDHRFLISFRNVRPIHPLPPITVVSCVGGNLISFVHFLLFMSPKLVKLHMLSLCH